MSRITHPMAEILFDENMGGPYGNTHVALGMAYKDCYRGNAAEVSKEDWEKMGFNDAAEHTDFISTTDRIVTAHLADGTQKVIYKDGKFVI
jgi:aminopeptidase